jgi:hypothetical protein
LSAGGVKLRDGAVRRDYGYVFVRGQAGDGGGVSMYMSGVAMTNTLVTLSNVTASNSTADGTQAAGGGAWSESIMV